MENVKRLYRSNTSKVIGGVCGGLADYLNIDVALIRVAFVLLVLFGGSGVLVYLIMWIAIPAKTGNFAQYEDLSEKKNHESSETVSQSKKDNNSSMIAGIALIFVGMLFLVDRLMPYSHILDLWPLLLVGLGVLLIKPEILRPTKSNEAETKHEVVDAGVKDQQE